MHFCAHSTLCFILLFAVAMQWCHRCQPVHLFQHFTQCPVVLFIYHRACQKSLIDSETISMPQLNTQSRIFKQEQSTFWQIKKDFSDFCSISILIQHLTATANIRQHLFIVPELKFSTLGFWRHRSISGSSIGSHMFVLFNHYMTFSIPSKSTKSIIARLGLASG